MGQGYTAVGTESEGISAAEQAILTGCWEDTRFALQSRLDIENSKLQHFHVYLDGRHTMSNDTVLITGTLQDSRTQETAWQQQALGVKVLVKISMQTWLAVVKHVSSICIRNAPLICTDTAPIIDTTTGFTCFWQHPDTSR